MLVCYLLLLCFVGRWRIVVHGGIDGYSRLPVYIKASDNNKASTLLSCFCEAGSCKGVWATFASKV